METLPADQVVGREDRSTDSTKHKDADIVRHYYNARNLASLKQLLSKEEVTILEALPPSHPSRCQYLSDNALGLTLREWRDRLASIGQVEPEPTLTYPPTCSLASSCFVRANLQGLDFSDCLVDTGAGSSFIAGRVLKELSLGIPQSDLTRCTTTFRAANAEPVNPIGKSDCISNCRVLKPITNFW